MVRAAPPIMSSEDDRTVVLAPNGHYGFLDLQPALHAAREQDASLDLTPRLDPPHVEDVRPRRFAVHRTVEHKLRLEPVSEGARRIGRHVRAGREYQRARLPDRRSNDGSGEVQLTIDLKQAIASPR